LIFFNDRMKEKQMERRNFIKKGILASASLSLAGIRGFASNRHPGDFPDARPENGHPLYFDGMTFLSDDPADAKKSGLSGLILDVSTVETIKGNFVRTFLPCLKSITAARREMAREGSPYFLATRGSQVGDESEEGKIAVFFQFQSLEPMTEGLDLMDTFYELGLRVCQVTHHATNIYGGGSIMREWTGLTDLGFKAIEKMNSMGIIPDLSHGNEILCRDVLKTSRKPVIASHTACRAIVNNARCITDAAIKGIADSGGAVGIFSMSFWLTNDPVPTMDHYIRQLEHVIRVGGIDAVGISNDYSLAGEMAAAAVKNDNSKAVQGYLTWWDKYAKQGVLGFDVTPKHCVIPELNNIKRFFTIQAALGKKGYKASEIEKIMGGNWVRILRESLG
jgi:membrane dipeptidase